MDLMSIGIWILLGAVAGWIAGQIMKGRGFGTIGNIIVGIIGSFLGGYMANLIGVGGAQTGGFNIASVVTAVIGAVVLLFIIGMVKKVT